MAPIEHPTQIAMKVWTQFSYLSAFYRNGIPNSTYPFTVGNRGILIRVFGTKSIPVGLPKLSMPNSTPPNGLDIEPVMSIVLPSEDNSIEALQPGQ
jgi:hypothetical protein